MKFFIDTANLDEIKKANAMGVIDGVTTNPSLLAKEEGSPEEIWKAIAEEVDGPVSAEVVGTDAETMVHEARKLAKIHDNIVIKIPMLEDGLVAIKRLKAEGIRTNTTLVFSPLQALLCAKAGTNYVSPFVGRLDDRGHDGMQLIEQIRIIYDNYGFETEILAASIRSPLHVLNAALIGADVATIPFNVITKLAHHPLTDQGLEKFLSDWEKKNG